MLTAEQRQALLPDRPPSKTSEPARPAPPARPTGVQGEGPVDPAHPAAGESNPLAKLAKQVAQWAWIPLFPIAAVSLILGLIAWSRASALPERTGRGEAILAVVMGSVFGVSWFVLALWLIRDWLVR